jgi:hypothetical protein
MPIDFIAVLLSNDVYDEHHGDASTAPYDKVNRYGG